MNMSKQDEFERTFLARHLPTDLTNCRSKEIHDIYIPHNVSHCKLRLRKSGDVIEMTKKERALEHEGSHLHEYTIPLTVAEFDALRVIKGKEVRKIRYYYNSDNVVYEVGVFQDKLQGLVVVDVEFDNKESMLAFQQPEWVLVEVTQENFLAGGELCGKSYSDISSQLDELAYKPIF
jgi:adenylate cyclase